MKKKDIVLTYSLLAEKGASEELLKYFRAIYPNGSASISEVLSYLQELAGINTEYVGYAVWIIDHFPPTQEPLVLNELTGKFIFHNGDINIKVDIDGEYTILSNGELNMEGNANLIGNARISAKKVKARNKNITLNDYARIWAGKVKAKVIVFYCHARIWVNKVNVNNIALYYDAELYTYKVDAENIMLNGRAKILAQKEVDAEKIAAYGCAVIDANKVNAKYVNVRDKAKILEKDGWMEIHNEFISIYKSISN